MATSPKQVDTNIISHSFLPSTTTSTINNQPPPPQPPSQPINRSYLGNPYLTTYVQADTSSFKQVVQMLTGSPRATTTTTTATTTYSTQHDPVSNSKSHTYNIPPVKSIPIKKNHSSGFKLYERRNSLKSFNINPLNPVFGSTNWSNSNFLPRNNNKPEILSPSLLDFPSLVLSPVTPLIPDPFGRTGSVNYPTQFSPLSNHNADSSNNGNESVLDTEAEEKAIKEKGFYLHPSPAATPREAEPRLLPLFPATSPRVPGSLNDSS